MRAWDAALEESIAEATPQAAVSYLAAHGWQRNRRLGRGEVWIYSDPERSYSQYEALVTLDRSVGDYNSRVADLIETLSVVEGRNALAVLTDITATGWDTRSIRLYPTSPSGTIPLYEAARAHEAAKELIQAAAITAFSNQPMAVQPAQKPAAARELVRRSRVDPSGAGSYVLTVRTPIFDDARAIESLDESEDQPERAFGRRVSQTLYDAVVGAREACALAQATADSLDIFNHYVDRGISSNLLDALAGFSGEDYEGKFEIRFSWGSDSPFPRETPLVAFPAGAGAVLSDGAKLLRHRIKDSNIQLRGIVVKLHRESRQGPGDITLSGYILDSGSLTLHRVRARLNQEEYSAATSAHEHGHEVVVSGSLLTRGVRLHLTAVTELHVLPD